MYFPFLPNSQLLKQTMDIATASPQVIGHRLTRMALAGSSPSLSDLKEFNLMGAEKVQAFAESFNAMAWGAFQANQKLAMTALQMMWMPAVDAKAAEKMTNQFSKAAMDVMQKGLAPIQKQAVSNAKRLNKLALV